MLKTKIHNDNTKILNICAPSKIMSTYIYKIMSVYIYIYIKQKVKGELDQETLIRKFHIPLSVQN